MHAVSVTKPGGEHHRSAYRRWEERTAAMLAFGIRATERRFGSPVAARRLCQGKWAPWDDHYTQRAAREGLRSRAAFKLLELHRSLDLFRPDSTVVDLGAAPGGWCAAALRTVRADPEAEWDPQREVLRTGRAQGCGRVIAVDVLEMPPMRGVTFLKKDLRDDDAVACIQRLLSGPDRGSEDAPAPEGRVDIVLSDMAPNTTGDGETDHFRSVDLCMVAMDVARATGSPRLLTKLFRGKEERAFVAELRRSFGRVLTKKPDASRKRANEVYIFADRPTGARVRQ